MLVQYFSYLKGILQGDLGTSIAYFPEPVSAIIGSGLYWTLFLAGCSLIISFTIGTFLGIIIAWNRTGKMDTVLPPVIAFFGAFPYFLAGNGTRLYFWIFNELVPYWPSIWV